MTDITKIEEFYGKTKEELLNLSLLDENMERASVGRYFGRVELAAKKGTFNTPSWIYSQKILVPGPYLPKTPRGIFWTLRKSVELLGNPTGEELTGFIWSNIDLRDKRSPYSDGRPCVPWIEDYITGAISDKNQYIVALNSDLTKFVREKKKND